ncbi:calcium-activated chloride channel regulator 3A-1-like [Microtus pennsylvanicus]|uniref:calcium-activated chloride channel regulator 3A-1-like n=1 Tax=Microtus pennsylvanicus TaxID=10058 RepID=UPI003F6B77D8
MVPGPKVLLLLSLHLLQETQSSLVHLSNNGYEGVVVAINPSVREDEKLIQSIKEMITQASTYLFEASKGRFYFRNVSILVPMTWKSKSEYLMPKRESYDKAEVIVADPYLKYGDEPYTLHYRQCGDRGQYIHFTPNFLLTDNLLMYGPRGRVFVHEWAHLRWGVFDEYNTDRPFYMSGKNGKNALEATRCSTGITGKNVVDECQRGSCVTRKCRRDSKTGLYEPKCKFIPNKSQTVPESIMFMQNLSSVVEFCTEKTHNTEAPNLQNKMCNHRSTWDVIEESADFRNASPMGGVEAPPPPTFSLLKSKQRVVCLVLDKSGSMNKDDRLIRMNQAAELYLTQIVEKKSLFGLVTFDQEARIQNYLTKITNSSDYPKITANLPQQASGGTSICSGIKAGFQVITSSSQSTSGSEIILLTDGEDDQISSCFEEVKHSGAIIHTIALGPSAAKELETLSTMTGGLRFYANKDLTALMDAFSGISASSGSTSQRALQLESKALTIARNGRINGTVLVDSTVGNDTFFVVTWTAQKPEIVLQDPKGKTYRASDFKDDELNMRSARLQIPGIAETGTWTYSLSNKNVIPQSLMVTVTTRARSPTKPPIIATAHMSQDTARYPSPMIVYARVSQGFLPVLGASVTAIIEAEDENKVTLELWDNGAGADTVQNDGIYTRYFTDYHGNGRYSLKVNVQARRKTARLSLRQQSKSLYMPGYIEDGKIIMNPPRPEIQEAETPVEDFSRVASGGSFTVSGAPPGGNHANVFPPCKVTDLEAEFEGDHIHLTWTAPGKVLDKGKASTYVIRMSQHFRDLQKDFSNATLVNTSGLIPREAGSKENFEFKPETLKTGKSTMFYIVIQAVNDAGFTSVNSNIAQAVKFIPPEHSVSARGPNISAIPLTIWGLIVIFKYILN